LSEITRQKVVKELNRFSSKTLANLHPGLKDQIRKGLPKDNDGAGKWRERGPKVCPRRFLALLHPEMQTFELKNNIEDMDILDEISQMIKDVRHLVIHPQAHLQASELKQLLHRCKKLETVSMKKSFIAPKYLQKFAAKNPNLRELDLEGSAFFENIDWYFIMHDCMKLKRVNLKNVKLFGCRELYSFASATPSNCLRYLNIQGTQVTHRAVKRFRRMMRTFSVHDFEVVEDEKEKKLDYTSSEDEWASDEQFSGPDSEASEDEEESGEDSQEEDEERDVNNNFHHMDLNNK